MYFRRYLRPSCLVATAVTALTLMPSCSDDTATDLTPGCEEDEGNALLDALYGKLEQSCQSAGTVALAPGIFEAQLDSSDCISTTECSYEPDCIDTFISGRQDRLCEESVPGEPGSTRQSRTTERIWWDDFDVLFVIDDSNSMLPFQEELIARFDELVSALGGLNADFHIGVVTTTMAAGRPGGGGRLQTQPYANCPNQAPAELASACADLNLAQPFLMSTAYEETQPDGTVLLDQERLTEDFRCIASVGVCGSPNEAGIDSLRAALTRSNAVVPGVLDTANDGFIRQDAALAVVIIADEDDCSFGDDRQVSSAADCYSGDLRPEMTSVQEVYDQLVSLKDGSESDVFIAAIIGPDDGVDLVPGVPFEDRAACVPEITTSGPNSFIASAYDGERYRQLVELTGSNGVEQSICEDSFADALRRIGQGISGRSESGCLSSTPETCDTDADCPQGVACVQPGTAEGNQFCADFEVRVEFVSPDDTSTARALVSPGPAGQSADAAGAQYLINYDASQCSSGLALTFVDGFQPTSGTRVRTTYAVPSGT